MLNFSQEGYIMMKKFGIGLGIFFITLYVLFLIAPFIVSGIANSYTDEISKMVEDTCGFKLKLENIRVLTTPKLTVGGGVEHLELALPNGETFLTADNAGGKLSLLPLLVRKIEIDVVGAENINLNLKVKKDGKFLLEDYILQSESDANQAEPATGLPLGFKLSNHLPDIKVNNYNISFIDAASDKSYSIYGNKAAITDFILNKKFKITADGKVMLQDREQFSYNVKLLNKIMPDLDLNKLVFEPQPDSEKPQQNVVINIIDIFKAIYNNQLTANVDAKIVTSGTFDDVNFNGFCNVSNLGVAVDGKKLPASRIDMSLKGNKINMFTELFTSEKDKTEIVGEFQTGKHPKISLNCKSNAQFKGIIDMIDSIAKSFGYKDLDTLTATGSINADFSVKSNLKSVESSGYLKIPSASIAYKKYGAYIDKIFADIDLSNSIINIKDAGLSIASQPLRINGTIKQDATADLNISANKLQLKGLLLAAGQMALLKENTINSGDISANISIKGRLDKISPKINVNVNNINLKNVPSNTILALQRAVISLTTDGKNIGGTIDLNNGKAINPALTVTLPVSKLTLDEKDININNTYILFDGSRIDITGKILDYLAQNIKLDILAKGNGQIHLKGAVNDIYTSQKLDLNLSTPQTFSIAIPGFKKSNVKTNFNIMITGNAINPILKGSVSIPTLKIPEMLLSMENLNISLNGPIVKGKGTLKKFVSGGIVAENLSSDFSMKNNVFYLSNLIGEAFAGKINGNISYNLANGHIGVGFKGSNMDAEKAIEGAAGLKNALSGKLGFNANVTLSGATDIEMMKNLKGKASFEITDGTLGNIGRFDNFLFAQNLQSNSIIRAAVNSVSALPAIKNTSQFKSISGTLNFNNGWAQLNPVKMAGNTMAYYITGRYNLLNATANVTVLGRLSAEVVALLGPLGDLSVSKLTSYIPKFGTATGNIINALTTDPKKENTALIPAISSKNYKDFKVQFNGGVESRSSVKSFKWLSKCDTSAIEKVSVKEQVQNTKAAVKEAYQQKSQEFANKLQQQREQAQEARQQMLDAKEGLKNFKNLLK